MLLKALFLAIVLYYVLKTAARLIAAVKGGAAPSRLDRDGEPAAPWEGAGSQRTYAGEEVEDAKFVDI